MHAVGEQLSDGYPPLVSVKLAIIERSLDAVDLFALPGNHVDDTEKGVITVEHRTRAANDFNPIDQVNIEDERRFNKRAIRQVVIDAVTINQQQHSAIKIAQADTSGSQKCIVAI